MLSSSKQYKRRLIRMLVEMDEESAHSRAVKRFAESSPDTSSSDDVSDVPLRQNKKRNVAGGSNESTPAGHWNLYALRTKFFDYVTHKDIKVTLNSMERIYPLLIDSLVPQDSSGSEDGFDNDDLDKVNQLRAKLANARGVERQEILNEEECHALGRVFGIFVRTKLKDHDNLLYSVVEILMLDVCQQTFCLANLLQK